MFVGAPELLTGAPLSGAGNTSPLILTVTIPPSTFTAFDVIVTDLLIAPGLFVSYLKYHFLTLSMLKYYNIPMEISGVEPESKRDPNDLLSHSVALL